MKLLNPGPVLGLATICAVCLGACLVTHAAEAEGRNSGPSRLIQADLQAFSEDVDQILETLTTRAEQRIDAPETARQVKQWASVISDHFEQALSEQDPRVALLNAWTLCIRIENDLERGAGRDMLGPFHDQLIQAGRRIQARLDPLLEAYLPEADRTSIEQQIRDYANDHPLEIQTDSAGLIAGFGPGAFSFKALGSRAVETLTSLPKLTTEVAGGVGRGATDWLSVNASIQDLTRAIKEAPKDARRQFEVVLDQMVRNQEDVRAVLGDLKDVTAQTRAIVSDWDSVTTGIERNLASARRTAPQLERLAGALEAAAAESRRLIEQSTRLVEQLRVDDFPGTSTSRTTGTAALGPGRGFDPADYTEAARAIESGAAQINKLLARILQMMARDQASPPSEPGEGFDVRAYEDAAHAIDRAARTLNSSLDHLQGLAHDPALERVVAQTGQVGRSTIDLVTWRLVQLLVLLFALIGLLMILRRVLARKS